MDIENIQGLVGWIIGVGITGLISIIIGVISIIRSGKMLPKDLKGADLSNEQKEADLAKIYKGIAAETALETIEVNKRLSILEEKVYTQGITIMEQNETIRIQGEKIAAQDETISILQCKLSNSEQYNQALIEQMKKENVTPLETKSMNFPDCEEILKNKKKREKNGNKT
jgi:uncharacterized coiled-coil protein SlyX